MDVTEALCRGYEADWIRRHGLSECAADTFPRWRHEAAWRLPGPQVFHDRRGGFCLELIRSERARRPDEDARALDCEVRCAGRSELVDKLLIASLPRLGQCFGDRFQMVEPPTPDSERDFCFCRRSAFPGLEAALDRLAIGPRLDPTENERLVFSLEIREVLSGETAVLPAHLGLVEKIASH